MFDRRPAPREKVEGGFTDYFREALVGRGSPERRGLDEIKWDDLFVLVERGIIKGK
jgi:hypothetical protein